jgi:DNA-binding NtrC family response regulator
LLAEDDAGVRALVERQLSGAGYRVLAAGGPDAAEAAARSYAGQIHLLLSDVVMPMRSGPALAESVRSARPDMRVLFMSGYPRDAIGRGGSIDEDVAFITKPFAGDALVRAVRAVLDGPSPAKG